jgi:hypothetical protein
MNIGLFVFVAVNFTLDFVSFMHVLCKCELKCCQTWSKVTNHDAGSMLFLFFALVGLILSFVGMYFGYITVNFNLISLGKRCRKKKITINFVIWYDWRWVDRCGYVFWSLEKLYQT